MKKEKPQKQARKSKFTPMLVVLLLILSTLTGALIFVNRSQRDVILAQDTAILNAEKKERELNNKIEKLEAEVKELKAASEKTEAVPEVEIPVEETKPEEKTHEEVDLSDLENLETQTLVDPKLIDKEHLEKYFKCYPISDRLFDRIYGDDRSFKTNCTVPREALSYLKVLHYDYDGKIRIGEMIINAKLEDDLIYIFRTLFEKGYQIEKMILVEEYGADDDTSVNDNNTSCFNFRTATDASVLSNHATGCAVDINPLQNPYFRVYEDGSYDWDNVDADKYWDRSNDPAGRHMINHEDLCYQLFAERGFAWGGDWPNPIDYQHFEKPVY